MHLKEGGQFYTADITTIAAGATYSTASEEIKLAHATRVVVVPKATGANASAVGVVTFHIQAKVYGIWTTVAHTAPVTMTGTTQAVGVPTLLDTKGYDALKVSKVVNGDATYATGTVNLLFNKVRE